jgi:hypothetical protein
LLPLRILAPCAKGARTPKGSKDRFGSQYAVSVAQGQVLVESCVEGVWTM